MLLRLECVVALRPEAVMLDIVLGAVAVRHFVERHVRNFGERIVERLGGGFFLRLQLSNRFLKRGDFGHQRPRRFLFVAFLCRADLLRRLIAARLRGFQFENFRAALLVERDQPLRFRRQAAPR